MNRWLLMALGGAIGLAGCSVRSVKVERPAHGDVTHVLDRSKPIVNREKRGDVAPVVILVERAGIRAVNPMTKKEQWFQPLRAAGHAVGSTRTVVVPLRGNRIAALDRHSGMVRWIRPLPGEAVSGISITEPWVVVATTGGQGKRRSRLLGISTHDGSVRWNRRTEGRYGVPAARGRVVFVPLDGRVAAFRTATGRELARVDTGAPVDSAQFDGARAVAAAGNAWVDLGAAQHSVLQEGQAPAFRVTDGLDPGHDDGEGLRWSVRSTSAGIAREALLMSRRAVVAVSLDPAGTATGVRWLHHAPEGRELVAMDVGPQRVTLVGEDGHVQLLSVADGQPVRTVPGHGEVRGALILPGASTGKPVAMRDPDPQQLAEEMRELLADPDPRVLPAQRLLVDVLSRTKQPDHDALLLALASGEVRTDDGTAAEVLRAHAASAGATSGDIGTVVADLSVRPSFLEDRSGPALGPLARRAVGTGDGTVVPLLVRHLLSPATSSSDLVEVARALSDLDLAEAVDGVSTFVVRYHADSEVVYESGAMRLAVDYLVRHAQSEDLSAASTAREALARVLEDPFTDPRLHAYIGAHLPSGTTDPDPSPVAVVTSEEPHAKRPEHASYRPQVPGAGL